MSLNTVDFGVPSSQFIVALSISNCTTLKLWDCFVDEGFSLKLSVPTAGIIELEQVASYSLTGLNSICFVIKMRN